MKINVVALAASVALGALASSGAMAAEKLTYYCSAQEDWCQLMAKGFELVSVDG